MNSWIVAILVLCIYSLKGVSGQDPPPDPPAGAGNEITGMFHCDRPGMNCARDENATMCNRDTGECTCEAGYEGYDCSVNSTNILAAEECEPQCQNSGQCVKADDGSTSCYCENYHGAACETSRFEYNCLVDAVEIKVTPFNNVNGFLGFIYVKNQAGVPECEFTEGDPGTWQLMLGFDQCGGAENETTVENDVVQRMRIIIQYSDLFLTETDQEITVECIVAATDSVVNNDDAAMTETDEEDTPLQQQVVTQEVQPVEVELLHADSLTPIEGPVRIGTLLTLRLTLNGGSVYDSFRCETITAHNGLRTEQLNFVENACVTERAGRRGSKIVTDFSGDVTSQIQLTFKLFKFRLTNQLAFRLSVKLCKGTGSCNATVRSIMFNEVPLFHRTAVQNTLVPLVCPDPEFQGLGRRRRAIDDPWDIHRPADLPPDSDDTFEQLSAGVFVVLPEDELETSSVQGIVLPEAPKTRQVTVKPGPCLQNTWIVLAILLTAIVCVMCGAIIGWFFVRRLLSKKKPVNDAGYPNPAYNTKI